MLEALKSAVQARSPGCGVERVFTAPGEAARAAVRRACEGGADLVVAAGGDGTLHEVVNGAVQTSAIVALLPMGTGNDFARATGLPRDPLQAADVVRTGVVAPVDLGRLGEEWFVNVAACGFDATVGERINRGYRHLRGTAAYLAAVVETLWRYRATDMKVRVDDQTVEIRAMLCAVANGISYGGGMRIAPDARWDDGLLDVCIVRECGRAEFLLAFPKVFRGAHRDHPKVMMLRGRQVHVESRPPVPVLVDGEMCGETPARFSVLPGALRLLLPAAVRHVRKERDGLQTASGGCA